MADTNNSNHNTTKRYVEEKEIGEGPIFSHNKVPPDLNFQQLVVRVHNLKYAHYKLAENYLI